MAGGRQKGFHIVIRLKFDARTSSTHNITYFQKELHLRLALGNLMIIAPVPRTLKNNLSQNFGG